MDKKISFEEWKIPIDMESESGDLGVLTFDENYSPNKIFKFYIMHTNFYIDEVFVNKLIRVPGLEALNIYSPYRARIAVGKLFKSRDVFGNIRNLINPTKNNFTSVIKKSLQQKYKNWMIYTDCNDCLQTLGANDEKEFYEKVNNTNRNETIEYECETRK